MLISNNIKTMKGSKIAIETLKNLGVDTIFGYPGGIVLDLYDELYHQSDIKHVLVRHEQSAVHAAEGYARTTGKCGVILVTSGPGATNTVSGIVNAYMDGYPLIVLTGQVFKHFIGKDAFQEADICDITKSCTKKVFQVTELSQLQSTLIEAFSIANSGKKGPVVVDLAKNIFSETTEYKEFSIPQYNTTEISNNDISRIMKHIFSASKPVIVSGGGVTHSSAEDALYKFVKNLNIPVVDTMMGLGTYPQNDENYLGMIGIFGDNSANQVLRDSDLIISLGARFNDRITCKFIEADFENKFIQIDINSFEISRNITAIDSIVGDIKDILNKMNAIIESSSHSKFDQWLNATKTLKTLNIKRQRNTNLMHSFEVIRKIDEFTAGKDLIFTSEVGQHQLWAVQNLTFSKNRKIYVSGGSGTMGFGFPAAIGAAIANPKSPVICISGDGSFQMSMHELATCVDYNLDLKIFILNNGYLGMVR
ncbi:biosynthetic-type acetolactate synthase large subunit, partial [bacterium]|nr:biosynthetic-type acetolactate synthase large subunit [bacterium]